MFVVSIRSYVLGKWNNTNLAKRNSRKFPACAGRNGRVHPRCANIRAIIQKLNEAVRFSLVEAFSLNSLARFLSVGKAVREEQKGRYYSTRACNFHRDASTINNRESRRVMAAFWQQWLRFARRVNPPSTIQFLPPSSRRFAPLLRAFLARIFSPQSDEETHIVV